MELRRVLKVDSSGNLLSQDGQVLTKSVTVLSKPDGTPLKDAMGRPRINNAFTLPDGTASDVVVLGMEVTRPSKKGAHLHMKPETMNRSLSQGWGSVAGGKYTLTPVTGAPHVYVIASDPGHYCCHCQEKLDGEVEARMHVQSHSGASPDPQNPSGYCRRNYFDLIKES